MKKGFWVSAAIFLFGMTIFCVFRYLDIRQDFIAQEREMFKLRDRNTAITKDLEEKIFQATQLGADKKRLEGELTQNNERMEQLKTELTVSRKELADLRRANEELILVNQGLTEQGAALAAKINQLSQEKDALLAKMSSVEDLRQMTRDLIRAKRAARKKRPVKTRPDPDKGALATPGNRGYVTFSGKPTYKSNVSIQVIPVE